MSLTACRDIHGGHAIVEAPPETLIARDVLMIPMGCGYMPGVFGPDGALIRAAAYFRGLPEPHFPLEEQATDLAAEHTPYAPDGPTYVFAGHLTGHYGHFFFALLSRLWALPHPRPAELKLVVLNPAHVDDLFAADFARTLFEALELTRESFACFLQPVRFRELIVPSPAVEENHLGHPAFAALCHAIADKVLGGEAVTPNPRPLYLTKHRLASGVHHIANEDVFCARLERRGVEVVSPERLSFRDQLALWAARPLVMGTAGSMMHTSIFTPGRTYLALNTEVWINSNQAILDRLNGNRGYALYPTGGYLREAPPPGFAIGLRLPDPERAADDFLREAARVRQGHAAHDTPRAGSFRATARRLLDPLRTRVRARSR